MVQDSKTLAVVSAALSTKAGDSGESGDEECMAVPCGGNFALGNASSMTHALYSCDCCERKCPAGHVQNIGSKDYPKYRCSPCNNSSKSYDRSLKSKGVDITSLKKRKWGKYTKATRKFRVRHVLDSMCEGGLVDEDGCVDLKARKQKVYEFVDPIILEQSYEVVERVAWMTQRQFVAWHQLHEFMTKSEAETYYEETLETPGMAAKRN